MFVFCNCSNKLQGSDPLLFCIGVGNPNSVLMESWFCDHSVWLHGMQRDDKEEIS